MPSEFVENHLRDRLLWLLDYGRSTAADLDLPSIESELRRLAEIAPRPDDGWNTSSTEIPGKPVPIWHSQTITTKEI